MKVSESLTDRFRSFGFSLYESKAYMSLVSEGIMSAPSVARSSDIPKSKVYETLDSLLKKLIIETYPGSPKMFKARSPDFVLDELISKETERIENAKRSADVIKSDIETIISNTEKTYMEDESLLWTINGRRGFHEKFAEMGSHATQNIKIMTPYFSRNSILEKAIHNAVSRGVEFIGLTSIDDDNKSRVKFYLDCFENIYSFQGEIPMTLVIIDDKECMYRIGQRSNGQQGYIGVYSTSRGLIKAFNQYWDGMINSSSRVDNIEMDDL